MTLLLATLLFAFTGYSLLYEELSYWGVTVAANINEYVPLIGGFLAEFIRYGTEYNANTVSRMFALHAFIFPPALVFLIALHVFLVRHYGVHEPGNAADLAAERAEQQKKGPYHFFPHHAMMEVIVFLYLGLVLILLSLGFPAGVGIEADPMVTPEHIQPEWYFYATFAWLKLFPGRAGILLLGVILAIGFCWPFIDRQLQKLAPRLELGVWIGAAAALVFIALTLMEAGML